MAQNWTDSVPTAGNVALTDIGYIRNNFTALKSSFSGTSAPPGAVAGMPYFYTTTKMLRIYNGTTWVDMFDAGNGRVTNSLNCSRSVLAGNGLTGGGALSADRTVTLGTPASLSLSTANAVTSTSHTHAVALFFQTLPHYWSDAYAEEKELEFGPGSGSWTHFFTSKIYAPPGAATLSCHITFSGSASGGSWRLVCGSATGASIALPAAYSASHTSTATVSLATVSGWQGFNLEFDSPSNYTLRLKTLSCLIT